MIKSILVATLLVFVSADYVSAGAFTTAEQKCRDALARNSVRLAQQAAREFDRCHVDRDRNGPMATDCNSVAGVNSSKIASALLKLEDKVARRCAGFVPGDLGYPFCPAPCNSQVPTISDFTDVAECLGCLVLDATEIMSGAAQGSPAVPLSDPELTCHGALGSDQTSVFRAVTKERQKCQRSAEKVGATTTDSCALADPKGKILKKRLKAELAIASDCSGADLASLDSCSAVDVLTLRDCVLDGADSSGETVFQYGYTFGGSTTTTTTTTSTTTTTLPQDPECPASTEVIVHAGVGDDCSTNGDCEVGTCDTGLSKCRTVSKLDTGWTGLAHNADVNHRLIVRSTLHCEGPFGSGPPGEPCGECSITGIDPVNGDCRCASDNRQICDEPFAADADDCGGGICNCYLGAPLPLSSGNVPVCVINRLRNDFQGTANVDLGEGALATSLRSIVHLAGNITKPCSFCTGDITPGDGVRDGTCTSVGFTGPNDGQSCDTSAENLTFPAPSGDGHSLDCFPDPGINISGEGIKIDFTNTTGAAPTISNDLSCKFGLPCHCLLCSGDVTIPCDSDAVCAAAGAGTCTNGVSGSSQNQCEVGVCNDQGGSVGECDGGPDDDFCDGVSRSNGAGYVACNSNADCASSDCGVSCGTCTVVSRRPCYNDDIDASGMPDTSAPQTAATFCIPNTPNFGINSTAGLPGPGRVINQTTAKAFCASDPNIQYSPGVGGCPP